MHTPLPQYRGVKVAVLGASGFIGRWVARALAAQGAHVFLVVRNKAAAKQLFSEYRITGDIWEQDVRDFQAVQDLLQAIKPSITFNLIGYGVDRSEREERAAYQINAHFVQAICEVIGAGRDTHWPGADIVHVGSALEYGAIGGDLSEDSAPNPTTSYGQSKLAGTRLLARGCETYNLSGLTARLFTVYGPGEHKGRLLPALIETAKSGKPLNLTAGEQKRDFTYVEEVAEGLLRLGLIKVQPGEVVNLATGKLASVRDFARTAAQVLQIPEEKLQFGILETRGEEMEHSEVTIERLRERTD